MPFPLKSATTLGALLGLGYSDESEAGWIGPKGFNRLFKSSGFKKPYDVAVEKAELLEKAGHSPAEIFDKTQLIRNRVLGGKWISAISDTGAKFSEHWPLDSLIENSYNAPEIYNHPELYKAYPEFKKLPITLTDANIPAQGLYLPYESVTLRNALGKPPGIIDVAGRNKSSIERVLSHEFGHAIQNVENWPRGGNPESAKTSWTDYAGPAIVKLLSEGKINDADNLLQRLTEINEGTDLDAYMSLGGEVLSQQNEHLLTRTNTYPNRSLGTNVAATEPLGPDKPLGYILPEYAKSRLIDSSGLPSPLDKKSYEILAESYHKITDPSTKWHIKYLLNQYAPDIQKQYNSTPDEFLDKFSKTKPNSNKAIALGAGTVALAGLLGVPDEAEASRYGIKRWPLLYHGIKGEPENAWEAKDAILYEGLTKGESAELELPGSSVSKDPWVSERLFTGVDPNLERNDQLGLGPNAEGLVAVDPLIPPSQVSNLSPARYLTGTVPDDTRIYGKPNYWFRESELFAMRHPDTNEQSLVKPRQMGSVESKDVDEMIRTDEAYSSAVNNINNYNPESNIYEKKRLLKDWMASLNGIRNRGSLFEQRFGRELIGNERGRYGTPALASGQTGNTIKRYQDNIWDLLKDTLSPYEYAQVQVKLKDLKEARFTLDQYASKNSQARKDLYNAMHSGDPNIVQVAEQNLTTQYNNYYEKRDKFFNFLNDKIGGTSTSPRLSKLPAAGVAGSLSQYADYNIGEAKPTNVFQETWQTNPVGQAATGFMRSPLETGAEMLNETQKMGSEFYGLPKQQTGTKILKYLEQEGAIPRKTDSVWEELGGLLGL